MDNKKVLIIEDDKGLVTIYQMKLSAGGYIVFEANTGSVGVSIAIEKKPDLILLDIMLPGGMNGFDVFEQLKQREETKKIPVIVLTNLDSERDTATNMGAVDYIVKADTSIDDLVEKVKKQLM